MERESRMCRLWLEGEGWLVRSTWTGAADAGDEARRSAARRSPPASVPGWGGEKTPPWGQRGGESERIRSSLRIEALSDGSELPWTPSGTSVLSAVRLAIVIGRRESRGADGAQVR